MKKFLFIPKNNRVIKTLLEQGFSSFILPLKNYSIGFDKYYSVSEINKLASKYEVSVIINKFLHKKELESIKEILPKLNNIKGFFIEDLSLSRIIPKNKVILNQNHILNNHKSINMYNSLGYKNVVISNELTKDEILSIRKNTKSKLFYFGINRNILLYSKRTLISNFNKNFNKFTFKRRMLLTESVSKHKLVIKEEQNSSVIFNGEVFNCFKYINELKKLDYIIINFCNLNNKEVEIILNNLKNMNINIGECKFLENKIGYRVKEQK